MLKTISANQDQLQKMELTLEQVNNKILLNEDRMISFLAETTATNDKLLHVIDQHVNDVFDEFNT